MAIKEVKAWETSDGKLFKENEKEFAITHDTRAISKLQQENEFLKLQKELNETKGVSIYHYTNGWKCYESPIGTCVYENDTVAKNGDECCYYCGEPEERK